MLLRVLEFCLTAIALTITVKEIILPLLLNQPPFPMLRGMLKNKKES